MRRYRTPLILLGVFVALLAAVLLTQNNASTPPTAASATPTADPKAAQLAILNFSGADAPTKLEVRQADPAKTVAFKFDNGKWFTDGPNPVELDTLTIASLVGQLNTLKGTALVTDKGDNLANYGLDKPSFSLNLTSPTKGATTLQVGTQNPATKVYYVKLDNDGRVWTVAPTLLEPIKGWLDKLPVAPPTPTPLPTIPLSPLPTLAPTTTGGGTAGAGATTAVPATTAAATTASSTTAAATTTTVAPSPTP